MTEATIFQSSNSEDSVQSTKETTPELNEKPYQSTDCTSTSGDENSSHSDVDSQENSFPGSKGIDFSELLRRKDEKIKTLEKENCNLRKICGEMTNQHEAQMQELVQELDRHVEIIENLQSKVLNHEQQIEQQRQQLSVAKKQLSKRDGSTKNFQSQRPLTTPTNLITNNLKEFSNSPSAKSSTDPDYVCAALSSFVQKNRSVVPGLQSNEVDEMTQTSIMEYLNAVMQNGAQFENDAKILGLDEELTKLGSNNVLSLLMDTQFENGNNSYETGIKSNKFSSPFALTKTVRDYVNDTKEHYIRNSSTLTTTSSISNGVSKSKFSLPSAATTVTPLAKPSAMVTPVNCSSNVPLTSYSSNQNAIPMLSTSSSSKTFSEEEMKIIKEMRDRISQNVARLGNQPLNTIEIAKQCKRLMVAYNIGQRLFARAVMCEVVKSQGSLSELLAKPRFWHKLTDKGREAFRRIFGWLSDDIAIELLCQMSPRRVAMPGDKIEHPTPDSLYDVGDGSTILADDVKPRLAFSSPASTQDLPKKGNYDDDCLGTLLFGESEEAKNISNDEFSTYRSKLPQTNIIVTKTVLTPDALNCSSPAPSIQDNCLNPVLSTASSSVVTNSGAFNSNASPTSSSANSSSSKANSRWRHDDIPREKIIGIFEAEKAKLRELGKPGSEDNCSALFFGCEDSSTTSPKASSVHSMLIGAGNSVSSCGTRNVKTEPTLILQEQFEKYPILDTEEVVKQIKDYLSCHSVSQRQFGENVLGLSQGSVSELLTRPKAWSMLTHKGREPFIRMKIFLDEHVNDEIPPPSLNFNSKKLDGLNFGMEEEGRETPEPDVFFKSLLEQMKSEVHSEINIPDSNTKPSDPLEKDSEEFYDTADLCRQVKDFLTKNRISQRAFGEHIMGMTSGSVSDLLSRPKPWPALSYKGRESYTKMANFLNDDRAMTTLRLNSNLSITSQNNRSISNSTFPSDVVTVRDLLTTSTSDVYSAVAAAVGANTNRSLSNVVHSATAEIISSPLPILQNSGQSFASMNFGTKRAAEDFDSYSSLSTPPGKKIPRFQRTIITDEQKEGLLFIFSHEQRPATKTIDQLSIRLGLSSRTVTNWFHNYRTRQKAKEVKLASEAAANGLPVPPLKPNPLQVADPTTKSWYKDLSELLVQNAANANIADSQSVNDSFYTNGDNNIFKNSSLQNSSCFDDSDYQHKIKLRGDAPEHGLPDDMSGVELDSDFIRHSGVEEEDDYGRATSDFESRVLTPKSTSSLGTGSEGGISSQLDKVIARLRGNNRLATLTS